MKKIYYIFIAGFLAITFNACKKTTDPTPPTNTTGPYQVTTVAGTGSVGFVNATGTAASFGSLMDVAVDGSGNLYVTDHANNVIRKINSAGVVSTFAGAGPIGSDDGAATSATFHYPMGITVDANGNLYIGDSQNNVIRKITSSGVVSTFAGIKDVGGTNNGAASTATFSSPLGVVVDINNNVFVADQGNCLIRKITSAGIVSTVAGTSSSGSANGTGTAASFNYAVGLTVDASGNIYVADSFNNLIRKITSAGVVTTIAGKVGVSGSADGTGTNATFNTPLGITVDANGILYVSDTNNNLIRKIDQNGVVTTIAGNLVAGSNNGQGTAASFNRPRGIAIDTHNNLYVADNGNLLLRKITL